MLTSFINVDIISKCYTRLPFKLLLLLPLSACMSDLPVLLDINKKIFFIQSHNARMCIIYGLIDIGVLLSSLQWRHNGRHGISNHQPHHCLLNLLFRRRSKKTSKLCVTGLCAGNSPVTGELPEQMANNMENVSIWWRHHDAWAHFYC